MPKTRRISLISWVLLLTFALVAANASAGTYPSYECASDKMKAAAYRCDKILKAWGFSNFTWWTPQWLLHHADRVFDAKWTSAEDEAAMEGVDCADMTLSGEDMKALMDAAIDEIVAEVNEGLDLGSRRQAICGSKLQRSAPVAGSSAITRLNGVQKYSVPSTRIGVFSNAVVDRTRPRPSETSPCR